MKVLQIIQFMEQKAQEESLPTFVKILIKHGPKSIVAYGRGTAHNCDNTIKIGNNLDFHRHALKARILNKLRNIEVSSLKLRSETEDKIRNENRN